MNANSIPPAQEISLHGARVLVVEDEYYIADDLRRILEGVGASIVGPFSTVRLADQAVDSAEFDCAIVDLNLNGESALPIAERLYREGRSFGIATGYASDSIPDALEGVPRIEKPFDPRTLLELVTQLRWVRA